MIVVARHLASATIGFAKKLEGRFQLGLEGHGLGLGHLPLRRLARLVDLPPALAGARLQQLRVTAGGGGPGHAHYPAPLAGLFFFLDPHRYHHSTLCSYIGN